MKNLYPRRLMKAMSGRGSKKQTDDIAPVAPGQLERESQASVQVSEASRAGSSTLTEEHRDRIADRFHSIREVQDGLRQAGLESSNLIFAVDFTRSNEWTGRHSFNGQCLHSITGPPNPYEQAIQTIGRTLEAFDDDKLIPAFGFGDATTEDFAVFSFFEDERPANGFEEVLSRYREMAPHVNMAGPTSFAPAIQQAMKIVAQQGMDYHILIILADGQVTRGSDVDDGDLSIQEELTIEAIVEASKMPLSIIMVGVGDGPWDVMQEFDERLPDRQFDNFQFVDFSGLAQACANVSQQRREATFALHALMEIPDQFKIISRSGMLGTGDPGLGFLPTALPPPVPSGLVPSAHPSVEACPRSTASPHGPGAETTRFGGSGDHDAASVARADAEGSRFGGSGGYDAATVARAGAETSRFGGSGDYDVASAELAGPSGRRSSHFSAGDNGGYSPTSFSPQYSQWQELQERHHLHHTMRYGEDQKMALPPLPPPPRMDEEGCGSGSCSPAAAGASDEDSQLDALTENLMVARLADHQAEEQPRCSASVPASPTATAGAYAADPNGKGKAIMVTGEQIYMMSSIRPSASPSHHLREAISLRDPRAACALSLAAKQPLMPMSPSEGMPRTPPPGLPMLFEQPRRASSGSCTSSSGAGGCGAGYSSCGGSSYERNNVGLQENFLCPISTEVMVDPVIVADGYTYERKRIEEWFSRSDLSPMTLAKLPNTTLIPNNALRAAINAWAGTADATTQQQQ